VSVYEVNFRTSLGLNSKLNPRMTYGVLDKEGAVFIQQFKKMERKLADLARI